MVEQIDIHRNKLFNSKSSCTVITNDSCIRIYNGCILYIYTVSFVALYAIGIKRKRIRGDLWHYKKICEELFASAHL